MLFTTFFASYLAARSDWEEWPTVARLAEHGDGGEQRHDGLAPQPQPVAPVVQATSGSRPVLRSVVAWRQLAVRRLHGEFALVLLHLTAVTRHHHGDRRPVARRRAGGGRSACAQPGGIRRRRVGLGGALEVLQSRPMKSSDRSRHACRPAYPERAKGESKNSRTWENRSEGSYPRLGDRDEPDVWRNIDRIFQYEQVLRNLWRLMMWWFIGDAIRSRSLLAATGSIGGRRRLAEIAEGL